MPAGAPPAPLQVEPPVADPLGNVRVAAAWTAFVAVVLAGMVLGSRPVLRHGRARGWRPGR